MPNTFDRAIHDIVTQAATAIAKAVRSSIAAEIAGIIGPERATPSTPRAAAKPKAAVAAAPRTGKKPGPTAKAGQGQGQGKKRRGVDPADLEKMLALIAKKPGLRSEQIQKEYGDKKVAAKVLAKLRADKKVKTKGAKRATTYHV